MIFVLIKACEILTVFFHIKYIRDHLIIRLSYASRTNLSQTREEHNSVCVFAQEMLILYERIYKIILFRENILFCVDRMRDLLNAKGKAYWGFIEINHLKQEGEGLDSEIGLA